MKKIFFLLPLVALPVHAQSLLGALNEHQNSLQTSSSTASQSGTAGGTVTVTGSSSSGRCEENDQTSLPLSYMTSLIQHKDGKLNVNYDGRGGSLSISAQDMISNCNSMLEWKLKKTIINNENTYAVEARFKAGGDCTADGCKYKIAVVENGIFKAQEEMVFKPTMKGFEECLQKSGVINEGKVVSGAIYSAPMNERFEGVTDSGNILFVSKGPSSPLVRAKYGNFVHTDRCDHYEVLNPHVSEILSFEDEERRRLEAEVSRLLDCKEYHTVAEFLEKYGPIASQLIEVRDRLILDAVKKTAINIQENKYSDEELKVLSDFEKYIVQPKIDRLKQLYQEMIAVEGDAKKQRKAEIEALQAELRTLNQRPYLQAAHTQKLIQDGKFEEAEKLNGIKIGLDAYSRVGRKENNVEITPDVAQMRIANAKNEFAADLAIERERYEVRTGQITGQSQYWSGLAGAMRRNIEVRTRNYTQSIQEKYAMIQPGGYCYRYFRNTQRCIQEAMEDIQAWQAELQHFNQVDAERAAEYDAKAEEYRKLESEGRRYIAAQNGEEAPAETQELARDTTQPSQRPQGQNGVYTFDFQPGHQVGGYPMQPPAQPNMFMGQQNPWQQQGMFGGQQGMMGQQAWGYGMQGGMGMGMGMGMNNGHSFNYGGSPQMFGQQQGMMGGGMNGMGGFGMQQPYSYAPQQGYWGQPYGAFNMYSMYGR
jgi:hypothetical protein